MNPGNPRQIIETVVSKVQESKEAMFVDDPAVRARIDYICRCLGNRAGVRLFMSCMLAKLDRPSVDPREPYTKIGTDTAFSGRTYDESHISKLIREHKLPCNSTTAFLTPALRNLDRSLTKDLVLVGRPARLYSDTLHLLDDVANDVVSAEDAFCETIRILMMIRDEKESRMQELLEGIEKSKDGLPLSGEAIINVIQQHLACKNASRLPVIVVAAAYTVAAPALGERIRDLCSHNAADEQTGAIGDIEVCLENEDNVVTSYEMKLKRVNNGDIDRAVTKIASCGQEIHNYVFITTDKIDEDVAEYAESFYEELGGVEIVILDCIGFLRHFIHFFHRLRIDYLDAYQQILLAEPDSAVRQPLKEAFLTLRQAAESDE